MKNIRAQNLSEDRIYHIFNRGINSENIFMETENYSFFLEKLKKYIVPYFNVYAYCLMANHFHLLVKAKPADVIHSSAIGLHAPHNIYSKQIGKLISSYTQAFNKKYNRHGQLLESPFKRIEVKDKKYLMKLVIYIHNNPETTGCLPNDYKFCSYRAIIENSPTLKLRMV